MVGIKKLIAGAAVAAVAGGGLLLGASSAFATTAAPWEPDPQALGTINFYNAAGQVVTSGPDITNAFFYASASNTGGSNQQGATKASLSFAFPDHTKTTPNFFVQSGGAATNFPVTTGPASITGLGTTPVATTGNTINLVTIAGAGTNDPTAGYDSTLQVRMFASGGTAILSPTQYWASDIHYNTTTGAWYETYPTVVNSTGTTLGVSASPAPAGTNLTLTATETPAVPGSVNFYDGSTTGTPLNTTPVAVNGSGVATFQISTLSVATHHLVAVFTPTDSVNNGTSEGKADAVVTGPATNTALVVNPTGAGAAGVNTTLTATVTLAIGGSGVTAGSVQFFDNGTTSLGTVPAPGAAGGVYALDLPGGLAAGGHSVTAVFTPTDPTANAPSTSPADVFSDTAAATGACAQTGSHCTDTQDIEAGIPVGTLTITTPYNGAGCAAPTGTATGAPVLATGTTPDPNSSTSTPGCVGGVLNIGTLSLNAADTEFTANTTFQDIVVTDTRSDNLGWTVQASSSDLTDGTGHPAGTIDSQNVGLTNIVSFNGVGFTGTVTGVNNPAAEPAVAPGAPLGAAGDQGLGGPNVGIGGLAHTVATTPVGTGPGSVTLNGTITLNAPTSTEAGVFTGTITFTVS